MNEPTPSPGIAQEPAADAAAPAGTGDFGAALRAAREAAGISVPTLASRLRLHVRQIEALERSDLGALPTLIYVRGFVRSCARELRIDVAPLLADLDRRAGVEPGAPLAPTGGGFPMARLGDGSRPLVAIALAVLVIAGVVGTLWPRRSNAPIRPAIAEAPPPSAALPEPAAAPAEPDTVAAAAPAPGATGAGAPAPSPTGLAVAARPGAAAAPGGASLAAAGNRPPVKPAPARAADAGAPVAAGAAAPPPNPAPTPAPEPVADAAAAAPVDGSALVLHVHASSWVEVVQANGASVFSQICPAGSVQTVHGEAPLRIVIGNAAAVEAQFRGVPVDLNRYANANGVARFTLQ